MHTEEMDEKLIRKINRQLRAIKFMLGFFMLMVLGMIAILGFLAYNVVSFTQNVENKVTNIENKTEQKLDIKSQLCDEPNKNSITNAFCN